MKSPITYLPLLALLTLAPASASASIIYTFTATSALCLPCGNTSQEPLPSFVLVVPAFLTGTAIVPPGSFLSGSNIGATTDFIAGGGGPGGHDLIFVGNSFGNYNYDFAAGALSALGTHNAIVGSFDGFSQTGTLTVTSTVPEPASCLLMGLAAMLYLLSVLSKLWRKQPSWLMPSAN